MRRNFASDANDHNNLKGFDYGCACFMFLFYNEK